MEKHSKFGVIFVLAFIMAIILSSHVFGVDVPAPDPIELYPFDGSGGTLSGTAGYSDTVFKVGTESLDTGSDGYATVSNGTGISGTNNWAITAWINPKATTSNTSPLSFGEGKFRMQAYSGSWYLFDSGYSNGTSLGVTASVSQWQFWAFTADASTAKFKAFQGFYYSGQWYLVERISVDINVATEGLNGSSVLALGARNATGGYKMPSYIDELLIWDTGLTTSDIQSVFESGQAGKNIFPERAIPKANQDSYTGYLPYNQQQIVTIYNSSGVYDERAIRFDPDITVTSDNATIGTVTWVSDAEVNVPITSLTRGEIVLVLHNQYSDLSSEYTLGRDSIHYNIDSNEYPSIMFGVGPDEKKFVFIKELGCSYIQHYGLGPKPDDDVEDSISYALDYLDLAEDNNLKVMMPLNAHLLVEDGNGLDKVYNFVSAVKDHNALGFWYLADEPEGLWYDYQMEDFYDVVKSVDANIPVAMAHCWCNAVSHWADFGGAEDILMPDIYPVYDENFPSAPLHWVTDFYNLADAIRDGEMPILQSFNRQSLHLDVNDNPLPGYEDYRYPNEKELRYWVYTTMVQGAEGVAWYSYGASVENGYGRDWLESTFPLVSREVQKFASLVMPAYEGYTIYDGQEVSPTDVYLMTWNLDTGLWVVLVNGCSSTRNLTLDVSSKITSATLEPWGRSRDVSVTVSNGSFTINDIQPWEVFVWKD